MKRKFKLNSGVKEMPLPTREEEITAIERLNLIEELLEEENYKEAKKQHSVLINSLVDLTITEKERLMLITYRVAESNLSFNLFDSALKKRELEYYVEMINLPHVNCHPECSEESTLSHIIVVDSSLDDSFRMTFYLE